MKDDERLSDEEYRTLYGSAEERARDASPLLNIIMLAIVGIVASIIVIDWLDTSRDYTRFFVRLIFSLFKAL
jgi:hypothetical protein